MDMAEQEPGVFFDPSVVDSAAEVDLELGCVNLLFVIIISMARLDLLVSRSPFLLNSTVLRQNPQNVSEWLKRVRLCGTDVVRAVRVFQEACRIVDANNKSIVGRANQIWLEYAKYHEKNKDLVSARKVLVAACNSPVCNYNYNIYCIECLSYS